MLAKLNHYLFLEGNIGINQMKRTTEELGAKQHQKNSKQTNSLNSYSMAL